MAEQELRQATLAQLAGSLGHDLRGPLINMKMGLQMLRAEDDPEMREELSERLEQELDRCNRLVEGLMDYARTREPQLSPTRLGAVIYQAASAVSEQIDLQLADLEPMPLDADQQIRLYENLLRNALEAAGPEGRVRVTTRQTAQGVEARVEDSGPGIPPEQRETVFEPLVSGRRRGTGLGLAVCRRTAEAHGGSLQVEQSDLGGAALVVRYAP